MGEEEREDLRDTLKLPVRLRRTPLLSFPRSLSSRMRGSGNPVLGIAVNPLVDCRIGGTPKPSAKGVRARQGAFLQPLCTPSMGGTGKAKLARDTRMP
jgi:hypothetical protein